MRRASPPLPIKPLLISQLNCLPSCGINPRRFLELLPTLRVPVTRVGKLRLVDAEIFRERIRQLAEDEGHPELLERQPETADEVLALLGLRRVIK